MKGNRLRICCFNFQVLINLQVQELRGNIRVFCRCRYDDSDMCALKFDGDERVICTTMQGRKKIFEFEKMYTPDTPQETVSSDFYLFFFFSGNMCYILLMF